MTANQKEINGVISALATPFTKKNGIDKKAFARQLEYMCGSGVVGFFIGGTTGEGAYLTTHEKQELLSISQQVSNGEQAIYAACIQPSTDAVLAEMETLLKKEPDYFAVVPPFYYPMTSSAIIEHYTRIADISAIPIILYDIPQRTHNPIPAQAVQELSYHSNIAGIKDSSGDFVRFSRMVGTLPIDSSFAWMQGNDYLDAASLMIGATAVVSGLSNVFPAPYVRLFNAHRDGNTMEMFIQQRIIQQLATIVDIAAGNDIAAVKAALKYLGICSKMLRMKTLSAADSAVSEIGIILTDLAVFRE